MRRQRQRPLRPAASAVTPATTAMLAALADRERSLRSVQSGAIMEYSAADGHHFRTHEEIALARPASMRVEAVAPFGATMVLAADDAGRLMIFDPSKNVLMSGGANAATLERYVRIPLAPPAAVDLLMGLAPDPAELAKPPDSVIDTEGMTVALWHLADGGTRELGFTAGQLAMVRERDSAGGSALRGSLQRLARHRRDRAFRTRSKRISPQAVSRCVTRRPRSTPRSRPRSSC